MLVNQPPTLQTQPGENRALIIIEKLLGMEAHINIIPFYRMNNVARRCGTELALDGIS